MSSFDQRITGARVAGAQPVLCAGVALEHRVPRGLRPRYGYRIKGLPRLAKNADSAFELVGPRGEGHTDESLARAIDSEPRPGGDADSSGLAGRCQR